MDYELLIRNGVVVDGSGAPRIPADVAVSEGEIAAIMPAGAAPGATARSEIDARAMVVAPGFIDLHSHSDWVTPLAEHGQILKPFLLQGVTTLVGGNCGFSTAPIRRSASRLLDESSQMLCARALDWRWETVKDLRFQLEAAGLALNVAHLAGHGSIRLSIMGSNPADPSKEELDAMRTMVEQAMADGAVGLSTGLGYFPGMIAKPPELAALAEIAGAAGGILTSHLRAYSAKSVVYNDLSPHNILAIREMVRVAHAARVPLQVSHLIFVGKRTWATVNDALAEVERARDSGVEIGFDTFPYTGGNTTVRVLFPAWSQGHLMTHLNSAQSLDRLRRETFGPLGRFIGKSAQLLWAVKAEFRNLEGKYFAEIADLMKMDPAEAYLTLARESRGRARVM
ncbi:MAG TPA: amidohydrolase family protein, partial [Candidatus Binataceae bacterium]